MISRRSSTLISALAIGIILGVGLSSVARAEGSFEIGTNQGLRSNTAINIDILDPANERVRWVGTGTLTLRASNNVVIGTMTSGQALNALANVGGVYTGLLSSDQVSGTTWDVSVEDRRNGQVRIGRVSSLQWQFDAGNFSQDRATNASFFAKVPGGGTTTSVVELRYRGLAGFIFSLLVNQTGIQNNSGRSVPLEPVPSVTLPFFPVYFNPPEDATYSFITPEVTDFGFFGSQTLLGCNQVLPGQTSSLFVFNTNVQATFQVVCDLDGDGVFDPTNPDDHVISGASRVGRNAVPWNGTTRNGDIVEPGTYECQVNILVGETHYLGIDIETNYEGLRMFMVNQDRSRTPLRMFWDDALVQSRAVLMPNGQFGLESSGPLGIDSGDPNAAAIPNVNARSWGNFNLDADSKGDQAALDTYTFASSRSSTSIEVVAANPLGDSDGDQLIDFRESCVLGTDPGNRDSDNDSLDDFVETNGGNLVNTDGDNAIDALDRDSDNDSILDGVDVSFRNPDLCADADNDTCDDCAIGVDNFGPLPDNNPANDGADFDGDGLCNLGDTDDDNDGVADNQDGAPTNRFVCRDSDGDTCDDCSTSGTSNPANDGADFDGDGLCNLGDTDDDNDGVNDNQDNAPTNRFVCRDSDGDFCDDCTAGGSNPASDGPDTDRDGICDLGDPDDDDDGVPDLDDGEPNDPTICRDVDRDGCDDCALGADDPANDGPDFDIDGICELRDPDDDDDGVDDQDDLAPRNPDVCRDADSDSCDDCTSGSSNRANDGTDSDGDGLCDLGDPDDDDDGVDDQDDGAPLNAFVCLDQDVDGCDDCTSGAFNPTDDGDDTDGDGICNLGDDDDDDDGVDDQDDGAPLNGFACFDEDEDGCDDCALGRVDANNDGPDTDEDGICNLGDPDDDGDGVLDGQDSNPINPDICRDVDQDGCDDCALGADDPANDGPDFDIDGICDLGDLDDDDDGVDDQDDRIPQNPDVCRDADSDSCDDCTSGSSNLANDGTDSDGDGLCDLGDPDDDDDGVDDQDDQDRLDPFVCSDSDEDTCDDCISGAFNPADDGADADNDGQCDAGDNDIDNDGVDDADDLDPLDPEICLDADEDTCDDCTFGRVDANNDGTDTDDDGLCDVGDPDDDGDGLTDDQEDDLGTDLLDGDSDDDGVLDGDEGGPGGDPGDDPDDDGLINALDDDSDNDGLLDGTELGLTEAGPDTDEEAGSFVPDADPATTTDPTNPDTDEGGVPDGDEDANLDGAVDPGERDPNDPADDLPTDADDDDDDGVADGEDNCPEDANPDQLDSDDDGLGDACDGDTALDSDDDGEIDGEDNCPEDANPDQADSDEDGLGDACDDDRDGDEVANDADNCPDAPNADQSDGNANGLGDTCDSSVTFTVMGGALNCATASAAPPSAGGRLSWLALLGLGLIALRRRRR